MRTPSCLVAWKSGRTPPGVSVTRLTLRSTPPNAICTGRAATASGVAARWSRLAARASWKPCAPGRMLSSPVESPIRKPLASRPRLDSARICSARCSSSRPSITNAFATASMLNGTPGSGSPGRAALSGAVIARRIASGSSRAISTRYKCRSHSASGVRARLRRPRASAGHSALVMLSALRHPARRHGGSGPGQPHLPDA